MSGAKKTHFLPAVRSYFSPDIANKSSEGVFASRAHILNHILNLKIRYANLELRLVVSFLCIDKLSNHGPGFPLVLPLLLLIRPYSRAKSRQRWAALVTGALFASVALARTERISNTSLSISFSARLLSACIRFIVMTAPR